MTGRERMPGRRGRRWLMAVLLATAGLVGAAPAQAHDSLSSSTPAAGAQVDQLPAELVLTFDQPALAVGTQIVVTGPDGPVQEGSPRLVDTAVRQPLRAGPPGRYAVSWRVTSADGHPVSGSFDFTTLRAGGLAAQTAAPASGAAPVVAAEGAGVSIGWVVAAVALLAAGAVVALGYARSRRRPSTDP